MTTIQWTTTSIEPPKPDYLADEAQLAAAAFLARYSAGRSTPTAPTSVATSSGRATSASAS